MSRSCIVAASCRAQYLAVTVFLDGRIIHLGTYPLPAADRAGPVVLKHILETVSDFDATMLVVEPGTVCEDVAKLVTCPVERLSLVEAKQILLGHVGPHVHQRLYDLMVAQHPTLIRFVRCLNVEGTKLKVISSERWKTNILIACALAVAAARRSERRLHDPTA